ncbi:vacuolar family H+-ATPase subunit H [Lachnotalea sp. AF33-28]|uniref:vacuolar family H+-ATPase subunit H n=1 Tax=Lachnotalea sp. AF33-28 TaxID=2292046 RepID=UPI000E556A2D|nr:vacuolar family H+-ATPase subunit H [Lachnotalea sp. AF33-28]RHP29464.1 vacuolar family H+-ATPase subunit H [Lachnotalea sp. AF33-28]
MSKIEQLISEIEAYIDECKPQPFTNNKKIIVEKDVIDELLVELRMRTPDEIKKYQKIISNKDAILSDAKMQADSMLSEASKQTTELINEHEIMRRAYEQANQLMEQASAQAQAIVDNAVKDANNIREGAVRYTDEMLKSLQTIISHTMENTQSKFQSYMTSMQGTYDIVTANRRELRGDETAEAAATTESIQMEPQTASEEQ